MDSEDKPGLVSLLKGSDANKVNTKADDYLRVFDPKLTDNDRKAEFTAASGGKAVTNHYYDLATDFYEYGWGESFHFSTLNKGESREHSFAKHEYRLALKLGLTPGDEVLDLGCGIGGPARHISAFSDCKVVGLNCNDYQLQRCNVLTRRAGLHHQCSFVKGDFNKAPFESESFSKAYAIEATCHAVDLAKVYGEVYRLLKPGGLFANYEWIVTDKYNPDDPHHVKIKDDILEGNALPELRTKAQIEATMKQVGFELLEVDDLVFKSQVPWWTVLTARWTLADLKITPGGRWLTHLALMGMETLGLAPRGAVKVHRTLCKGADALVLGGKEGIFSPMLLVVGRKPVK